MPGLFRIDASQFQNAAAHTSYGILNGVLSLEYTSKPAALGSCTKLRGIKNIIHIRHMEYNAILGMIFITVYVSGAIFITLSVTVILNLT